VVLAIVDAQIISFVWKRNVWHRVQATKRGSVRDVVSMSKRIFNIVEDVVTFVRMVFNAKREFALVSTPFVMVVVLIWILISKIVENAVEYALQVEQYVHLVCAYQSVAQMCVKGSVSIHL
jgi:prophage DNA circulation protein